jgi:ubiquinone/menaquinone biosynthesis C-methylase UbiE
MAGRRFNWLSSSDKKNTAALTALHEKMIAFYSEAESRSNYQQMVDSNDNDLANPGAATLQFIEYLKQIHPNKLLEVGCGSGRIYQFIEKELKEAAYTGVEVSEHIIEYNRRRFDNANWFVADAYTLPVANATIDVCFSFYVLEHLVFPERALIEMLRTVKSGGYLVLIFPDFAASGRFASQNIGLSNNPTAVSKLKKGKVIDALISLYDSRIRLPKALKNAAAQFGSFPVNINPKCLAGKSITMSPDIDAVYIASKKEVANWAAQRGYCVSYPAGTNGYFAEHSFISIQKIR